MLISVLIKKKADNLLAYPKFVNALPIIADNDDYYIRELNAWKPKSYNPDKLFKEFIRHLAIESQNMANCVSGYSHNCAIGKTSIWVFTKICNGQFKRLANIEVSKERVVREIKAKANTPVQEDYMLIIWQWIGKENLYIGTSKF